MGQYRMSSSTLNWKYTISSVQCFLHKWRIHLWNRLHITSHNSSNNSNVTTNKSQGSFSSLVFYISDRLLCLISSLSLPFISFPDPYRKKKRNLSEIQSPYTPGLGRKLARWWREARAAQTASHIFLCYCAWILGPPRRSQPAENRT